MFIIYVYVFPSINIQYSIAHKKKTNGKTKSSKGNPHMFSILAFSLTRLFKPAISHYKLLKKNKLLKDIFGLL
jgi:hypothetical protein